MIITLTIDFLSLYFIISIFSSFVVRKKDKSGEVAFFWRLGIVNFIGLILEILTTFSTAYFDVIPNINMILHKLYMLMILLVVLYISSFTCFLYNDEINNTKKGKIVITVLKVFFAIEAILVVLLPIHFHAEFTDNSRYVVYAEGIGTLSIIIYSFILFIMDIYYSFRYRNAYFKQRLLCLVFYSYELILSLVFRKYFLGINVLFSVISLVTIMIYFVIENYDVKKVTQLKELTNQANEMNEDKNKFLSNMSSEIRTNLNTILVTSTMLLDSDADEETKDDVKDIVYASESLLEIVGNILDLNKIESDEMEVNIEDYNLKKEAESLADMTSIRIEDKPIKFVMNIDQSIPDTLRGDKAHIKQIINNLLTNGFKYTNEGSVVFNVRGDNDLDSNICHLTIEVKDTGIGIKDTSRLFNKFDRLDMDKKSNIEGTGLGLVITKKMVDLMKGKLEVESELGKGSKFTVTVDQEIVNEVYHDKDSHTELDYNFGNRRILIIDDNKLNLKVARKVFENFKLKVDTCFSGEEAVNILKNNGYDAIFTDVFMADENGYQILREGKKYNTPVVALTADAIQGAKEKYLKAGFVDYIAKPYTNHEIYDALEKLFRKK